MQKKINIIIWSLIPCLILFFVILTNTRRSSIRVYEENWEQAGHQIMIKVYGEPSLNWDTKLGKIKRLIKEKDQIEEQLDQVISDIILQLNTASYIIQIDEYVTVGKRYQEEPFQVATMTSDHQLFKIMALEQQALFVTDVTNDQAHERIFIIAPTPMKASEVSKQLQVLSLEEGKMVAMQLPKIEVYWLKQAKVVGHVKTT